MNKEQKLVPTSEEGIQEWKQSLQLKQLETALPSPLSKTGTAAIISSEVENQVVCSPSWRNKGIEIASAIRVAVRKTVDSLMAPLDGRKAAENFDSPEARKRVSSLSEDAPQFLAQQLLGELEKAAAKVALNADGCRSYIFYLCFHSRNSHAFLTMWCLSPRM